MRRHAPAAKYDEAMEKATILVSWKSFFWTFCEHLRIDIVLRKEDQALQ
jgi:hypothetical protein